MTDMRRDFESIRRNYGKLELTRASLPADPITLFECWMADIVKAEHPDPTAMVLATVDKQGHPDTRVLLLKGIVDGKFIFYSNYSSHKAEQLSEQPVAALNFYWSTLARQVRIRGDVSKISAKESKAYFETRPKLSQISAIISPQSSVIKNREVLEKAFHEKAYQTAPMTCPDNWGGYSLNPQHIEFWQGRDNRLHDRFNYTKTQTTWQLERLAP